MKQKQTTPAEETEDKRPNETPDGGFAIRGLSVG